MITIYQTNDIVKFVLYTLAIPEEMIYNEQAGKIATHTILNLIENSIYAKTKSTLIQILNNTEVDLTSEKFYTFCILIDFTARCFISDVFYEKLEVIHKEKAFDRNASFEEMKTFYLKHATGYFYEIKELFKEETQVLQVIDAATDWAMNDESFRK